MAGSIEWAGLVEYYRSRDESLRLGRGEGLVEFERTQHLIRQVIPPTSRVVDVGGGDGVHARWLYFHRSEDFLAEVAGAGFTDVRLRGVEGPAWALIPPDCTADHPLVEQARFVAALADEIDSGVASSSHVLAFGTAD